MLCQAWKIQSPTHHTAGSAESHLNETERRNPVTTSMLTGKSAVGLDSMTNHIKCSFKTINAGIRFGFDFGWFIGIAKLEKDLYNLLVKLLVKQSIAHYNRRNIKTFCYVY